LRIAFSNVNCAVDAWEGRRVNAFRINPQTINAIIRDSAQRARFGGFLGLPRRIVSLLLVSCRKRCNCVLLLTKIGKILMLLCCFFCLHFISIFVEFCFYIRRYIFVSFVPERMWCEARYYNASYKFVQLRRPSLATLK